jgi:hypothetical protein
MLKTIICLVCFQCSVFCFGQIAVFNDLGAEFELDFTSNGCQLASGLSFIDFDGNQLDDIFFTSCQGQSIRFFTNSGNGFESFTPEFLTGDSSETRVLLWADYDNDGDKDLFIGNSNARNKLYRNLGGGVFVDYTNIAGLSELAHASYAASWADYDKDGWLDLYVANRSIQTLPMHNKLYHNNGDGTLTDVTSAAGVGNINGATIATGWLDYNNDGWPDIYNANDRNTVNRLFRNNGDGTFTNMSNANVNLSMDAMSVTVADIDNNDFLDIYITNDATGNKMLMNNGDGTFTEMAEQMQIQVNKGSWGSLFLDYDNDGDFDLLVAAMSSGTGSNGRSNDLFKNENGQFVNVTGIIMPIDSFPSMGAAMADYNQDGFYDIAILNANAHRSILLSNSGNNNHWIKVKPQGVFSNRDAVGSWIYVWSNGQKYTRYTQCGANFASQSADYEIIGIGEQETIDSVVVQFPLGIRRTILNPEVNTTLVIPEVEVVLSQEDKQVSPFVVWPNPFQDSFQISTDNSSESKIKAVTLLNTLGQEVRCKFNFDNQMVKVMPDGQITKGVFLLLIQTEDYLYSHLLVHVE